MGKGFSLEVWEIWGLVSTPTGKNNGIIFSYRQDLAKNKTLQC